MRKLIYIGLIGALLLACSDSEKDITPDPDPKPGTGDVAALVDGDIETYYESEGSNVEIVLELGSSTDVVAYSLYSAGGDPETDPVKWTMYGSTNGLDWTLLDTRENESFFARYQEHLFHLEASGKYSSFKFEMQPSGGEKLRLSEVVFHAVDPDAGWEDFTYPSIIFQNTAPDTRGSEYYDLLVQDKQRYLQYHAKEVAKLLYFSAADQKANGTRVNTITYKLEDYDGVSAKSGSSPNISIVYSTRHIENSYASSMFTLDFETKGVLFHEMTHAYQLEPRGIPGYNQPNTSWQIIEGMADAVRAHADFFPWSNRKPGGYWQDGYQTTGFFLEWLTTKDPDALRKINASMLTVEPWSFDGAMEYTFGPGTTTDDLWKEYQNAITN